jgi:hypothetical protein
MADATTNHDDEQGMVDWDPFAPEPRVFAATSGSKRPQRSATARASKSSGIHRATGNDLRVQVHYRSGHDLNFQTACLRHRSSRPEVR